MVGFSSTWRLSLRLLFFNSGTLVLACTFHWAFFIFLFTRSYESKVPFKAPIKYSVGINMLPQFLWHKVCKQDTHGLIHVCYMLFLLVKERKKRDFYHRTEAMALCEGYLLAFPTVSKSLHCRGLASYFPLKTSVGESARRYRNKRICETSFILLASSALYWTKRERWKLCLTFEFSWNIQFLLWRTLCYQVMCPLDVHAVCVFPPISAFEQFDAVPPCGTLLVSGSLHTVTQTEQTPAPVPRLVLINYQQRLYPAAAGGKQRVKRNRRECGIRFFHHQGSGVWHQGSRSSPTWDTTNRPIYFFCCLTFFFVCFFFKLNVHYLPDAFNYWWIPAAWWCWWFTFVRRDPPQFTLFNTGSRSHLLLGAFSQRKRSLLLLFFFYNQSFL